MELDKHIRDNAARRESFMALAERVFGLSFRGLVVGAIPALRAGARRPGAGLHSG